MTRSTHTDVKMTQGWLTEVEKNIDSDTGYDCFFVRNRTLKQTRFSSCHAKRNPNFGKVLEKIGFRYAQDRHFGTKHYATKKYILELE